MITRARKSSSKGLRPVSGMTWKTPKTACAIYGHSPEENSRKMKAGSPRNTSASGAWSRWCARPRKPAACPTAGTSWASSASRGAPSPETWISCARRRGPRWSTDEARHGFRLTDETFSLPPVRISRREAFSFALARKLLAHYEATPLHMDMRAVLDKIAESLEGGISIEPDWLSEHVGVLPEDRVRIDPEVWAQVAGHIERREAMRADYQSFAGRVSRYGLHPLHLLANRKRHANRPIDILLILGA